MSVAKTKSSDSGEFFSEGKVDEIVSTLEQGGSVREKFGRNSRLCIDRPLPFLCIYRKPEGHDDKGTAHLILAEASYLITTDGEKNGRAVSEIVKRISRTLADKFGAFLIIEVWAADAGNTQNDLSINTTSKFRIFTETKKELPSTVETLKESLESLNISFFRTQIEIVTGSSASPPGMQPILDDQTLSELSCLKIGLEISPIYRDGETGEIDLSLLLDLRRKISKALQKTFFEFVHVQTPERPTHPEMLGKRLVVEAVWSADAELSALSDTFNYLFAVTPVNSTEAFEDFQKGHFKRDPVFHYRLLTIDPEDIKRRLYSISFDEIEDPTMAYLLRDKRIELDRQIQLIEDRNTPRFLYESLQIFPPVEAELMHLAELILASPKRAKDKSEILNADQIAKLARDEIKYYRDVYPEMTAEVEIRKDFPPGLMVSNGNLMIGDRTSISRTRTAALLQHEIGTHSVTYFNGRAQPLKLLYSGLPGYEQLQEGLAVFSEYLVGGLSFGRLRTLAARVVAVRRLIEGRSFAVVFDELVNQYNFGKRTSFNIAMRVFRGGGLTKDAVYLRGLVEVVKYLSIGGDIETLYVGKMGPEHVSIIRELQWREVLLPAPLIPRYMTFSETADRLKAITKKTSILDLVKN